LAFRTRFFSAFAFLLALLMAAGCSTGQPGSSPALTENPVDEAAAADQAKTFHTLATADDWGNYGEVFSSFCTTKFGFDCNREDRDIGDHNLSSAQEVQQWDAERNNPQSGLADIGILFIPQAREAGVLADYEAPNATLLPDNLHGPGWVTTFAGVPTFIVNVGFLEAQGLPVPESWADLTNPAYANPPLIGLSKPGVGASGTWSFVAMNTAAGGSLTNWAPGIEYGKKLLPNITQQASLETFERGEVPISIRFDHAQIPWMDELDARGVNYRVIVPSDGSVYADQTLMMNRFDAAHDDFAKMFMEWVLSDQAQILFSKYGARPIRTVAGDNKVTIPTDARVRFLPDADYAPVVEVDWQQVNSEDIANMWENQVVGGG